MGYCIRYPSGYPEDPGKRKGSCLAGRTLCFFLLFLVLTNLFWPRGAAKLRQMVAPWDAEHTARAVVTFREDLRAGETLEEAALTFCRELLDDGQDPD